MLSTFLLVIAGGLVTSNDAALSVPDWPLSYGRLVPALEGGIRFEFAHRALALVVALLSVILALWLQAKEPRRWLRRLGWMALAAVLSQAALGAAAVKFLTPKPVSIAHACLAQAVFGLMVAIAVGLHSKLPGPSWKPAPLIAAGALFVQTVLGAAVRHGAAGLIPHIAGAVAATGLVMWAGLGVLMHHMEDARLRRPAMLLLSLTFSQVFLGMGAYMSRIATADAPQPMPMMVWFTVAHVAAGSLAFGAAVTLAMIHRQAPSPEPAEVHGGMAVA